MAQSEAMSKPKTGTRAVAPAQLPANQREYKVNHGGVNYAPPPLTALQKVGLEIEGKGF